MKPGNKLVSKQPPADPAHDVLRQERQPLDVVFAPKCVAVIGATDRPGSVGRRVLWALLSTPFGGTVFPVSKERQSVLGIKAYPNVAEVPEKVDLAVIVVRHDDDLRPCLLRHLQVGDVVRRIFADAGQDLVAGIQTVGERSLPAAGARGGEDDGGAGGGFRPAGAQLRRARGACARGGTGDLPGAALMGGRAVQRQLPRR